MCLIETAPTVVAEHVLTYMDRHAYIPRSLEITGTRKDKVSRPDSSGTVREVIKTSYEVADTSTDLLLRVALQRRGLALEMGGSWPTSHTSPSRTFPMPGHKRTTLEQLRRADQQIWEQLKTKTKKGIKLERLTDVVLVTCTSRPSSPAPKCRLCTAPRPGRQAATRKDGPWTTRKRASEEEATQLGTPEKEAKRGSSAKKGKVPHFMIGTALSLPDDQGRGQQQERTSPGTGRPREENEEEEEKKGAGPDLGAQTGGRRRRREKKVVQDPPRCPTGGGEMPKR